MLSVLLSAIASIVLAVSPASGTVPLQGDLTIDVSGPFNGAICGVIANTNGDHSDEYCEDVTIADGGTWVLLWPFSIGLPGNYTLTIRGRQSGHADLIEFTAVRVLER